MPTAHRWTRAGLWAAIGFTSLAIGAATLAAGPTTLARGVPDIYGINVSAEPLLPPAGGALPISLSLTPGDHTTASPPMTQAIPTPTAFHAGIAALVAAILTRSVVGRYRRARRTA